MSFVAYYIISIFIHTICALVSTSILVQWCYLHCKNKKNQFFKKLSKTFIFGQYLCVLLFTMTCVLFAVDIWMNLISNGSKTMEENIHVYYVSFFFASAYETSPHAYIHMTCIVLYFSGKFCAYVILYSRLKLMLNDSIFAYSASVYNKICIFLICYGVTLLLIPCTIIFERSEIERYTVSALWVIFDATYYFVTSYMFISKLKQIRKTYHNFIVATGNKGPIIVDSKHSPSSFGLPRVPGTSINSTESSSVYTDSSTASTSSRIVGSAVIKSKIHAFRALTQTVSAYTKLTIIVIISSVLVFVFVLMMYFSIQFATITFIWLSIDCVINVACLLLYFEKPRNFYYEMCCSKGGFLCC